MATVPYALYDAFTDRGFSGSQAAIVSDAAYIDSDTRLRIAREFGFPATCFVTDYSNDSVTVRFQSVEKEYPMCGHGTICLMTRMIDGLDQSVQLDIPFLMDERTERMANLKDIMQRSDVTVAEKFRKVMEAYQIENDYGTSSEFYEQSLTIDGVTRAYNMLRIGRIGLYFQSDDTKVTGRWDNEARQWVIDDSARNEVRKGLRMARQLIAPELIIIPVPSAEAS